MIQQISAELFTTNLYALLAETFESVHGIYLDRGTSLFETLEGITAAQASRATNGRCATLAAQVDHTRFYLDVTELYMIGTPPERVDWQSSWQVGEVTEEEWAALKQALRDSYNRVRATMVGFDSWDNDSRLGGALAIIMHTARHMGGFGIYYVCWWIDMNKELSFVHPGEILLEEFLVPMGISQNRLALDICVPARRINEITQGKRRITTDTALRLARYFNMSPQFWLGLQLDYDLDIAEDELADRIAREAQVYSSP